MATTVESVYIK